MGGRLIVLSWDELLRDAALLVRKIKGAGYRPDLLVAVARGGWVIGRILSDCLGVDLAFSLTIKSYKGLAKREGEAVLQTLPNSRTLEGKTALVVDDVSDSGSTLKTAVKLVQGAGIAEVRTATLYVKPRTCYIPDFYVRSVDGWVVFPYEYCETLRELGGNGTSPDYLEKVKTGLSLVEYCCEGAES